MKKSFNIFVTPPLVEGGLLLEVVRLSYEQLNELYSYLKKNLEKENDSPKGVSVSKYVNEILLHLVVNTDDIVELLGGIEDKTVESKLLWGIYYDLIEIYPALSLKSVLLDSLFIPSVDAPVIDPNANFQDTLATLFEEKRSSKMVSPKKKVSLVSKQDVEKLERYLKRNLVGQDQAIDRIMRHLKVIVTGLTERASFFFLGPTGVGKTQLVKLLAAKYGAGLIKINCGEYSKSHEYAKLIGSPPGFIGHSETSFLGDKAKISSKWVFLFDEIEKADEKLFDLLLSPLDDGTIDDSSKKTLNFKDSLFFFTSNNGLAEHMGKVVPGFGKSGQRVGYEEIKESLQDDLKKKFKPEFLNRINEVILFNALTPENAAKIARINLKEYPIKVTKELVDKIVDESFSEEYGAREIHRYISSEIAPSVADSILDNNLPRKGTYYHVKVVDGKFEVVDTERLEDTIVKEVVDTINSKKSLTPKK